MVKRPIDSFVKYFLDVKPYHTKILEIVERYLFKDDVNIDIQENPFFHEYFINDPLCKPVGFGLHYDNGCGFSSYSCCDLFECVGGYGLIFDNSDLLVNAPVAVGGVSEANGTLTLDGDFRYDTFFTIKEVTANTITIIGDATALFEAGDGSHNVFLVAPSDKLQIQEVSANGFWVAGNYKQQFDATTEFVVHKSQGNDSVYSVLEALYDTVSNRTFIRVHTTEPLFQGSYNGNGNGFIITDSNTKNNGVYQKVGYIVQAPTIDSPALTIIELHPDTPVKLPDETDHGSVVFRTGLFPERYVWLNGGQTVNNDGITPDLGAYSDVKIIDTAYDIILDQTTIAIEVAHDASNNVAEDSIDLSQIVDVDDALNQVVPLTVNFNLEDTVTVQLRGYHFGAGYDGLEECSTPLPSNVNTGFAEYLVINMITEPPENVYFVVVSEDYVPPPIEQEYF